MLRLHLSASVHAWHRACFLAWYSGINNGNTHGGFVYNLFETMWHSGDIASPFWACVNLCRTQGPIWRCQWQIEMRMQNKPSWVRKWNSCTEIILRCFCLALLAVSKASLIKVIIFSWYFSSFFFGDDAPQSSNQRSKYRVTRFHCVISRGFGLQCNDSPWTLLQCFGFVLQLNLFSLAFTNFTLELFQ